MVALPQGARGPVAEALGLLLHEVAGHCLNGDLFARAALQRGVCRESGGPQRDIAFLW